MTKSSLAHMAPHAARRHEGTIRVRATKRGFYDNSLRTPGDEFTLQSMQEFSNSWMKLVGDDEPAASQAENGATGAASNTPAATGRVVSEFDVL